MTIAAACSLKECLQKYKTAGITKANTPQSDEILPNISRIIGSNLPEPGILSVSSSFISKIDRVSGHITLVYSK